MIRNCPRCGDDFHAAGGDRICGACRTPKDEEASLNRPLSARELQVIGLVADGKPNKVIAAELHLTEGTIKEYLSRIFKKAGVTNRTELAVQFLCQKGHNHEPQVA